MKVETFEVDEVAGETHPEVNEEALRIIRALKLEGQEALIAPKTSDSTDEKRVPYREMTRDEFFAYTILCPEKRKAKDFSTSPIPIRVLQVLEHATSLGYFAKIEVWDRASVLQKDPVLVGCLKENDWDNLQKRFLLARWGEELQAFPDLLNAALKLKREQLKDAYAAIVQDATLCLNTVDSMASDRLIARNPNPTAYLNI